MYCCYGNYNIAIVKSEKVVKLVNLPHISRTRAIIIRQPLYPVVGRRPQHAVFKLPCRLSAAWLVSHVVFSCHMVHRLSLRRLICTAQDHFIFLTVYIIFMTFVLSLTQMLVLLSLYVMLSILLSMLVCAVASLFCACLVSVQVSAPYVITGSTQELYTCLFRQMARLLLKKTQCLAYEDIPVFGVRTRVLQLFCLGTC